MSKTQHKLAQRVRMARVAMGWTQAQLAELSGISQGEISRIEAGVRTNPSMDVVLSIARAFDLTVEQLLGE